MVVAESVRFQAHLQRGGVGIEEMRRLVLAYAESGNYETVKERALRENLLGKTSERLVKDMLYAFRRRFLSDVGLPPAELVAQMLQAPVPEAAKTQTLFPYFIVADPLVERCYRDLVLSRLNNPRPQLTRREVQAHLMALSADHPELAKWSENLRQRWGHGFLALLRHFGLMERRPKTDLRKLWLLPEPFAFFWLWFWQKDGSFWAVMEQPLWEILQLDEAQKEVLLVKGQLRHWWTYQRSGAIVDLQPIFASVKEWLQDGLVRSHQ